MMEKPAIAAVVTVATAASVVAATPSPASAHAGAVSWGRETAWVTTAADGSPEYLRVCSGEDDGVYASGQYKTYSGSRGSFSITNGCGRSVGTAIESHRVCAIRASDQRLLGCSGWVNHNH